MTVAYTITLEGIEFSKKYGAGVHYSPAALKEFAETLQRFRNRGQDI